MRQPCGLPPFGVDVAAVQVDDPLGDGEAEAGAAVASTRAAESAR